ncbi:MAG: hypothetical protein Tsb0015_00890 [Simkaniaceae bacterium]
MSRFLNIVECAIEYKNKFLIIERPSSVHAGGLLAFPGGKVEFSDGRLDILHQAVKREIFEEVGIKLMDPIFFITSSFFVDSNQDNVLDMIFYCRLEKSDPAVVPNPLEVPKHYWLSYEEVLQQKKAPNWLKQYIFQIITSPLRLNIFS